MSHIYTTHLWTKYHASKYTFTEVKKASSNKKTIQEASEGWLNIIFSCLIVLNIPFLSQKPFEQT